MAKLKLNDATISGELLDIFDVKKTPIKSKDADGVEFDNEIARCKLLVDTGKGQRRTVERSAKKFNSDGTPSSSYSRVITSVNSLGTKSENPEGGDLVNCVCTLDGNTYYNKDLELVEGYTLSCRFCNTEADSKFPIKPAQYWKAYGLVKDITEEVDSLSNAPYLNVKLAINKYVYQDGLNAAWGIIPFRVYKDIETFKKMFKVGAIASFKGTFGETVVETTGAYGTANEQRVERYIEIGGGFPPVATLDENGYTVLNSEICNEKGFPFTEELIKAQEKNYAEMLEKAKARMEAKLEKNTESIEIDESDIPF